jgi:hypothetical protein
MVLGDRGMPRWVVVRLVEAEVLRLSRVGSGRETTTASSVAASSFVSCTFAAATTAASGPPSASTRMLRFTPALPRSVGFRPT